jgi:hypothetical protein
VVMFQNFGASEDLLVKTNEQAPSASGVPQQRATRGMLGGHFFAAQPAKKKRSPLCEGVTRICSRYASPGGISGRSPLASMKPADAAQSLDRSRGGCERSSLSDRSDSQIAEDPEARRTQSG